MNHPAAFRRSPPGPPRRPHQGASVARQSDPIVTQQARASGALPIRDPTAPFPLLYHPIFPHFASPYPDDAVYFATNAPL